MVKQLKKLKKVDSSSIFEDVSRKKVGVDQLTVGFEWEVPVERGVLSQGYQEDYTRYRSRINQFTREMKEITDNGFRTHFECGGTECASPIFYNISTARSYVKLLKKFVNKHDEFNPRRSKRGESGECCGIHVHMAHPSFYYSKDDLNVATKITMALVLMMNRGSTSGFVKEISGRRARASYSAQSVATGWDNEIHNHWRDLASLYRTCLYNSMFKENRQPLGSTIECRLWDGHEKNLDVAVDMAHSLASFILSYYKNGSVEVTKDNIPTLKDWAAWVNKKKGYRTLKENSVFNKYFSDGGLYAT